MDLYDGHNWTENKGEYMDEDGCDSSIIGFFWSVTEINLMWNVLQLWKVFDHYMQQEFIPLAHSRNWTHNPGIKPKSAWTLL